MLRTSRFRLPGLAAPLAWLVLAACATGGAPGGVENSWEGQMRAGGEAFRSSRFAEAADHYHQALAISARQPHQPSRIAYSAWHLGDACFAAPGECPPGTARQRTEESLQIFAALYGPEHPVVIPILLRLADIDEREGNDAGAASLRTRADAITERTFPESHFMRVQNDGHRPAADLDPQELLRILAEVDILGG